MLFHLLYPFHTQLSVLNVTRYITFRTAAASLSALAISLALGPWLVTTNEFAPRGLREVPRAAMSARVNGVEYSRADLDGLWWSFAEMLSYAAEGAPVRRGDVLGSGTCGTGCILELALVHGSEKYPYLQPGDEVELEVDGLGVLTNRVEETSTRAFTPDPERVRPRLGQ